MVPLLGGCGGKRDAVVYVLLGMSWRSVEMEK